ncbi:hypothetical protein ACIBKY_35595 [Nonomuraea sp. NPDC050394]|uniref:hypothetical protein n=1 Tax=Nonomuraea sp. NPDC050394 TaxID=3364363 RepID=UPI00378CDF71
MRNHATPAANRPTSLAGFTVEEAALTLMAFSTHYINAPAASRSLTADQVRQELSEILATYPMYEIWEAMALIARAEGGPHPDDMAHLEWWRQTATAVASQHARQLTGPSL